MPVIYAPIHLEIMLVQDKTVSDRLQAVEDKMALKELVDTFSVLADKKAIQAQTLLFTENATVKSYVAGNLVSALRGRQQIEEAFTAFLNTFDTVYHLNGQHTVTIAGDVATGISYCLVTLIGQENKQHVRSISGVHYQDEYVRANGHWLISKRISTFAWQDRQII